MTGRGGKGRRSGLRMFDISQNRDHRRMFKDGKERYICLYTISISLANAGRMREKERLLEFKIFLVYVRLRLGMKQFVAKKTHNGFSLAPRRFLRVARPSN